MNKKGNVIYCPKGRWLYLFGEINKETAKQFAKFLTETQICAIDWSRPITILINSNGGDSVASLLIHLMLKEFVSPIITVASKKAYSGAFTVFESGRQRIMMPSAELRFHWASWFVLKSDMIDIEDLDCVRKKIQRMNNCLYGIIRRKSRQKLEKVKNFFREEKIITAKEAKKYNLTDVIIPRGKIINLPTSAELSRLTRKYYARNKQKHHKSKNAEK